MLRFVVLAFGPHVALSLPCDSGINALESELLKPALPPPARAPDAPTAPPGAVLIGYESADACRAAARLRRAI